MKKSDLQFSYPEELVATSPQFPSRVLWVDTTGLQEITLTQLLGRIPAGDVLVVNNTKVLKRRIFAQDSESQNEVEILFLDEKQPGIWEVLFPSRKMKLGQSLSLPGGVSMTLLEKGRPQKVKLEPSVSESYFREFAELPLPPYIQKARHERHNHKQDETWYQTAWSKKEGSFAAPTASLHFTQQDLDQLQARGVRVIEVTLHVGLGTFLPVTAEDLDQHEMHQEYYSISETDWRNLQQDRDRGGKVWAMGTTAVRAVESAARGELSGFTNLLLQPGSEFRVVDRLLTNFHQPESTLLALVMAFAAQMLKGASGGAAPLGPAENFNKAKDLVNSAYKFAMDQRFRLFSYGDLSVWSKN